MSASYVLEAGTLHAVNELGSAVKEALSSPQKARKMKLTVKAYVDSHAHTLTTPNLGRRLYFRDPDAKKMYDVLGVSEFEVAHVIKKHQLTDPSWKGANKTLPWVLVLAARQFELNKDREGVEHALIYMALFFYSSIQYKYFRFEPTGANEAIFQATLNDLSNKFKLKQHGSVIGMLSEITMTTWDTYRKDVIEGTDLRMRYFANQLRSRINDAVKNVAKRFYPNWEKARAGGIVNRLYIDQEREQTGSDGEQMAKRPVENTSLTIARISDSALNRSMSVGVDKRISSVSARVAGVSQSAIEIALERIVKEYPELTRELIGLILEMYFAEGTHTVESIGSKAFFARSIANYTRSNTNDVAVIRAREILEELLAASSEKYLQSERAATKSNFKKACYIYLVLMTQQAYLHGG